MEFEVTAWRVARPRRFPARDSVEKAHLQAPGPVLVEDVAAAGGFDRLYSSYTARPTAVTNVYRMNHDVFLEQRFARHVSPLTTTAYTHPSDNVTQRSLRRLGYRYRATANLF